MMAIFFGTYKEKPIWTIVEDFTNKEISKEELQAQLREVFPCETVSAKEMEIVLAKLEEELKKKHLIY